MTPTAAPTPVVPMWVPASIVCGVLALGLILLLIGMQRRRRAQTVRCPSCRRVMLPDWTRCRFCNAALREERAQLDFVAGPLIGTKVQLDRDVTTIGSTAGNTVILSDVGVSRKHVGIRRVEGGYELADLGSTNGVYVNGEKVARRRLSVGDVIRVGATEIVFRT